MNGMTPDPAKDRTDPADRAHVEEVLDDALEDSFPASDPPSITEPKQAPRPHDAD